MGNIFMMSAFGKMGGIFRFTMLFAALATALPVRAAAPAPVIVTPLFSTVTTPSGQPITMPRGDLRVMASTYLIAPGARLPLHKHPYPRYGYVLEGTLRVTDTDTHQVFVYRPGDVIVEVIGQWHFAENIGTTPVKLIVFDTVPLSDTGNTIKAEAKSN
jgi:quercetin dioxygenase-like cupin family protein